MKDFISVGPLRLLQRSSRKVLGPGNLGVLIARAGVGKTACLIHIALEKIFRQERLVHISLEEGPEKVTYYYNVIYHDFVKALDIHKEDDAYEYRTRIDKNRMILAYLNQSFDVDRLRANLNNLRESMSFIPDALLVDGLDFEKAERDLFKGLKEIAEEFAVEIWLSALSHRHIDMVNERGIPYPCHRFDDLFSIIIHLQPEQSGIYLKLLKDHDRPTISDTIVRLAPNTLLALD